MRGSLRTAIGGIAALAAFLVALGFVADLLFGLPLLRSSRSWTVWILATVALAIVYLLGEGVGTWINARDSSRHPLWKRAWHLALLLGMALIIGLAATEIVRISQ